MTWISPGTWTVGMTPTSVTLNNNVYNNMAVLLNSAGFASRLNPASLVASEGINDFPLGDNVTYSDATMPCVINWDLLNAVAPTVQWRMRQVANVVIIVSGSPSLVNITGTMGLYAGAGEGLGNSLIATAFIGSGSAIANTAGYKTADSGWQTVVSGGLRQYQPMWRTGRIGGSGAGTANGRSYFPQVRVLA
jgi:hypothetical protein